MSRVEDIKTQVEEELVIDKPHIYRMPRQLGGDWAYQYKGTICDGFKTKKEAEKATGYLFEAPSHQLPLENKK